MARGTIRRESNCNFKFFSSAVASPHLFWGRNPPCSERLRLQTQINGFAEDLHQQFHPVFHVIQIDHL
jgi:hypothetical protein